MTKRKTLLLGALILALAIAALWLYWEQPLNLGKQLPKENWVSLEFAVGEPGVGETGIPAPELEAVLSAINQTQVTRHPEFPGMTTPYFRLLLYKGEGYPTILNIQENGLISVANDLDLDHWFFYEGGEGLYFTLQELVSGTY